MVVDALATVLIVEDDPGIAELERGRLEDAGYRVVVAGDADAAAARLRDEPVDLVLLDYRLPGGVDGLEFYARLRADGFDPPVILVTGFSDEGTVIRALRAGVRPEAIAHRLRHKVLATHQLEYPIARRHTRARRLHPRIERVHAHAKPLGDQLARHTHAPGIADHSAQQFRKPLTKGIEPRA